MFEIFSIKKKILNFFLKTRKMNKINLNKKTCFHFFFIKFKKYLPMNLIELSPYLFSEKATIKYLIEMGIIKKQKICFKCKKTFKLNIRTKEYIHSTKSCSQRKSLYSKTCFQKQS